MWNGCEGGRRVLELQPPKCLKTLNHCARRPCRCKSTCIAASAAAAACAAAAVVAVAAAAAVTATAVADAPFPAAAVTAVAAGAVGGAAIGMIDCEAASPAHYPVQI